MIKRFLFVLMVGFVFALGGCTSLNQAGITEFEMERDPETGVVKVHWESGKDFKMIDARIEKTGVDSYEARIKAEGVEATEAIKQSAAVAKETVKAAKEWAEIGAGLPSP